MRVHRRNSGHLPGGVGLRLKNQNSDVYPRKNGVKPRMNVKTCVIPTHEQHLQDKL